MKKMRLLGVLSVLVAAVGCGGGTAGVGAGDARSGRWQKGSMPAGGSFDGVYQSDWGRLELTAHQNGHVTGLFEDEARHSGRLEGRQEGNLLSFDWRQWNYELGGKLRESRGKGVFQYVVETVEGSETRDYVRLLGWFGYETGGLENRWNAVKLTTGSRKRLKPFNPRDNAMEEAGAFDESVGFPGAEPEEPQPDRGGGSEATTPAQQGQKKTAPKESSDSLDIF